MIQDKHYNYAYDQENRLLMISYVDAGGAQVAGEYRYDALSRRIVKKTGPARGNKETHYFYDDARIIEEQSTAGITEANYVYGNYIDEVLTMDRGLHTYYYHQNALWSVEAITDGAANVVETYAYDAYGHPTITDGLGNVLVNAWRTGHSAIGNPWLFTGRQYDEETGLYYYRARIYDSGKGRFLQRDQLISRNHASSKKFDSVYTYVENSPTRLIDPWGLKSCCKCTKVQMGIVKNPDRSGLYCGFMGVVDPTKVQFHIAAKHPFIIETTGGDGCHCKYHDVGSVTYNGQVTKLNQTTDPIPCKSDTDYPGAQPIIKITAIPTQIEIILQIDLLYGIECVSSDGSKMSAIGQTTLPPTKFIVGISQQRQPICTIP